MVRDHDRVGQGVVAVMAERAHELGAGNPSHESLEGMSAGRKRWSCGPESGILTMIRPRRQKKNPAGLRSAVLNPAIKLLKVAGRHARGSGAPRKTGRA